LAPPDLEQHPVFPPEPPVGLPRATVRPHDGRRGSTQRIIEANIARFKALLADENDPTKRAMLHRLLREERAARAAAKQMPDDVKKAY
jgi:hypothetical protein